MNNLVVYTLYSGSSGNCVYVKSPDAAFLIDAGVSAKAVESGLASVGSSLSQIAAIFVTHEHIDHVRGLEVISKKYHIPTHMVEASARTLIRDPRSSLLHHLYLHPPLFSVCFGNTVVRSFITPHDSAASVGYTVEYTPTGAVPEKIGIATDIGHLEESMLEALAGSCAAVIEANHDTEMLLCGPYPYALKCRILSERGHLSNTDSGIFAKRLAEMGTTHFLLAHLSKENNLPQTAEATVRAALTAFPQVTLAVARPDKPVVLCGQEEICCK